MSSIPGNIPMSGVSGLNLASMDIETALLAVQSERTRLLDTQLANQIQGVQNNNNKVAQLNDVLNKLNAFGTQIKGTDAGAKPADSGSWDKAPPADTQRQQYEIPLNDALRDAGVTDLGFKEQSGRRTQLGADGKPTGRTEDVVSRASVSHNTTKGEVDAAITKIKGMIDAAGNSQQMDMLRLQSMSNKRNEAFDVMTNFVKKMQDSRSSIISNMR